jgi:hypothetical protein
MFLQSIKTLIMTENEKIVNIIVEKNIKLYGEIQECCLMYKNFCRCDDEIKKNIKIN